MTARLALAVVCGALVASMAVGFLLAFTTRRRR